MPHPKNKTDRLLVAFAGVAILPEHINEGDQTESLRGWGFAPATAQKLVHFGIANGLVCQFGRSSGAFAAAYSWKNEFLFAAIEKHEELFGGYFEDDFPRLLLDAWGIATKRESVQISIDCRRDPLTTRYCVACQRDLPLTKQETVLFIADGWLAVAPNAGDPLKLRAKKVLIGNCCAKRLPARFVQGES